MCIGTLAMVTENVKKFPSARKHVQTRFSVGDRGLHFFR
jgi:hypothetical protein